MRVSFHQRILLILICLGALPTAMAILGWVLTIRSTSPARGARAAIAEDIEELAYLPEEWGYDGEAACAALLEYNRQCESGELEPGRRLDPAPLVTPPYYVIEVIPAITFTFTGLQIDERARVLGAGGEPIRGLLAAGADAGGVFHRAYAGGLAAALVFGLQAAVTAARAHLASHGTEN